jgi:hypothetical protein
VLQPGERVLAAVRAVPEGSALGALGGLITVLVLASERRREAEASGFPASRSMLLAVTDRRVLVFRNSVFHRLLIFRGEVPFESLQRATVDRRGLNLELRFLMSSRAQVCFTTYRLDHPQEFTQVLNRALQERAHLLPVAARPAPSQDMPLPPPPPS